MDLHAIAQYYRRHTATLQDARGEYAVLIPLLKTDNGLHLLYEVRATSLHHHRGEVCFPGGHMEPGEAPAACALRETWEELGIAPQQVQLFGEADYLHLRSEGIMHPVVGLLPSISRRDLVLNPQEVRDVFTVSLSWLRQHPPQVYRYALRPDVDGDFPYAAVQTPADYTWAPGVMEVPVYRGLPYPLWGLTARITMHFIQTIQTL